MLTVPLPDGFVLLPQTFQHQGVARAAYVQFYWYTEQDGDGNYLHPVPAQALIGSSGRSAHARKSSRDANWEGA